MQLRQRSGQMGAIEGIIIFLLMVALGGLVYLLFKKDSSPQIYKAGSNPRVIDVAPHPSFGGCVDVKVQEYKDGLTNNKDNSVD